MKRALILGLATIVGCAGSTTGQHDGGGDQGGGGFAVGGMVSGLVGTLVLENNGGDDLMLSSDGPFTFATRLADGAAYAVTVAQQPDGQICTVTDGSGNIRGADLNTVQVTCATAAFTIGGTLSGLGTDMVTLRDNSADDLSLTADGPFTFATAVGENGAYDVTISTQAATHLCSVTNGTGTANADVTNVMVACVPTFAVGGSVSGLNGTVVLRNNGGDDLSVTADGTFHFAQRLIDGAAYSVTVATQPIGQRCDVTSGTGSGGVMSADISSVAVTCQNTYTVGGNVSGMVAGTLVLRDNGGNDLVVNFPNTSFVFTDGIVANGVYAVTVSTQPTGQFCSVSGDTGNVGSANVTTVVVTCRLLAVTFDEIYARPGTGVYGDANADGVRDSDNDEFVEILNHESFAVDISAWSVKSGGASLTQRFAFPAATTLAAGQRAVVFGGGSPTGSFGSALVFKAGSLSLTDVPSPTETVALDSLDSAGTRVDTYSYGTTTFGSSCTTKCQSQTRANDGSFVGHTTLSGSAGILCSPGVSPDKAIPKLEGAFSAPVAGSSNAGISGHVTVQLGMFMDPTDFDSAHFKLVPSPCAISTEVPLTSVVVGADASQVVLAPAGNLSWATPYCVEVVSATRSANETPLGADASYVFSTVNPGPTFTIGGNVNGLVGTVVLQNEGSDNLTLTSPAPFTFATPWPDGAAYQVTVLTQPAGQFCSIINGSNNVSGANVTNIDVECATVHNVTGTITGMTAGTIQLLDNGGDPQNVLFSAPQTFTFAIPIAEGASYDVSVGTQPTGQYCTVNGGTDASGVMGTSDVSVSVSCRPVVVQIDEIHYNPATNVYGDANGDGVRDSSQDEFIEIVNNDTVDVNIGGWVIAVGGTTKHTFAGGTMLAAGQRAVRFGGGSPIGSFGSALVGVSDHAFVLNNSTATVSLLSAATGGITVDSFTYTDTQGTCNNSCASLTRSGATFIVHAPAPGILWSPGTAPSGAIPKLSSGFSTPHNGQVNLSVQTPLLVQLNMFMNPSDLVGKIRMFASSCAAATNELTLEVNQGSDPSFATVSPTPTPSPLDFSTTYCIAADSTMTNAVGVSLGTTQTIEFTTRPAMSAPSANVVISEYGGTTPANPTNNEFVELYNPTVSAVDLSGWMIQRRTGGGTATCWAILPSGASIAGDSFYLVGGAGFVGATDFAAKFSSPSPSPSPAGTTITFSNESVVLKSSGGICTDTTNIVDTVSIGTITDTLAALQLPAWSPIVAGTKSVERKACYNSTGDTNVSTGMFTPGGHSTFGNSEHIGASNSDFVLRTVPEPQNSSSPVEIRGCP